MNHSKINFFCIIFILCTSLESFSGKLWDNMQSSYRALQNNLASNGLLESENMLYHSHWQAAKEKIKELILGPENTGFLQNPTLSANMVSEGWSAVQQYEISFLKNCSSPETRELISKVQEHSFASSNRECAEFNCTSNTLRLLFYAGKAIDPSKNKKISTIVEFGSGFGNLARIFKSMLPDSTIILIDLPELLAIQYFFLSSTLPNIKIILHTEIPTTFEPNAIHLVAVHYVNYLTINADIFISSFALSETTPTTQNNIINKKFFEASTCYIVGQLAGNTIDWTDHRIIHKAIRSLYNTTLCYPSPLIIRGINAYEILGTNY